MTLRAVIDSFLGGVFLMTAVIVPAALAKDAAKSSVESTMNKFVDKGEIAGAVTLLH